MSPTSGWIRGEAVLKNRARFALEVTKAVTEAVGSDRVGIRLSPYSNFQDMKMKDPIPQFTCVIKGLRHIGLAYLHLVESRVSGDIGGSGYESLKFAFEAWDKRSPVLVAGGFRPDTALKAIDGVYGHSDVAIVFGRYFISNPDLPYRIKNGIELMKYNRKTFYPKERDGIHRLSIFERLVSRIIQDLGGEDFQFSMGLDMVQLAKRLARARSITL